MYSENSKTGTKEDKLTTTGRSKYPGERGNRNIPITGTITGVVQVHNTIIHVHVYVCMYVCMYMYVCGVTYVCV